MRTTDRRTRQCSAPWPPVRDMIARQVSLLWSICDKEEAWSQIETHVGLACSRYDIELVNTQMPGHHCARELAILRRVIINRRVDIQRGNWTERSRTSTPFCGLENAIAPFDPVDPRHSSVLEELIANEEKESREAALKGFLSFLKASDDTEMCRLSMLVDKFLETGCWATAGRALGFRDAETASLRRGLRGAFGLYLGAVRRAKR